MTLVHALTKSLRGRLFVMYANLEMSEYMQIVQALEAIQNQMDSLKQSIEESSKTMDHGLTKLEVFLKIKHKSRLPKPSSSSIPSPLPVNDRTEVTKKEQGDTKSMNATTELQAIENGIKK